MASSWHDSSDSSSVAPRTRDVHYAPRAIAPMQGEWLAEDRAIVCPALEPEAWGKATTAVWQTAYSYILETREFSWISGFSFDYDDMFCSDCFPSSPPNETHRRRRFLLILTHKPCQSCKTLIYCILKNPPIPNLSAISHIVCAISHMRTPCYLQSTDCRQ